MDAAEALFARLDRELWLVTAQANGRRGGLIATFVNSASIVPDLPRVLVGVARGHFTWELIEAAGAFALHLLGESNLSWVWRFGMTSGRDADKFVGLPVAAGATGSPIVSGAVGWLDCRVENRMMAGDRSFYLAEVLATGPLRDEPALTVGRMLELASPDQRAEMQRQRQADAVRDAAAILKWRTQLS